MRAFIGGFRDITRGLVQAGAARRITRGVGLIGGQLRTIVSFIPPLSVSANSVSGTTASGFTETVTSNPSTATPAGGAPPYSYAWATTLGGASPNSPNLARTTFSETLPPGFVSNGTARVTVTDSRGTSAFADITVRLENVDIR